MKVVLRSREKVELASDHGKSPVFGRSESVLKRRQGERVPVVKGRKGPGHVDQGSGAQGSMQAGGILRGLV